MTRRIFTLLFSIVLCAADAVAGTPQWVQVHSPNFTVFTDAGEKRGREVALHFEQMRIVFATLFDKAKITSSQPLYILAFRNDKEFRNVCPLWKGKPEQLAGYFQPGNGVTYIALDLGAENKWQTVFHEYAHFLLNSNSVPAPPWFDEGFAEYYSTVRVEGDHFVFGNVPQGDPEILQQYTWLPIDQLFSVTHNSPIYNERNHQTIFYAESWLAMAHYWFNSSKYQKQVMAFLVLHDRGMSVDDAIQKAFGMDAKALDKELHGFYWSGRLSVYKEAMPPGTKNIAMTAAPMDQIDARSRIAELKLQMRDHRAEAVQEFEQIVKERPDDSIALRALAYAALQSGDKQKAVEYFRRASVLKSNDPHVYYFSAALLAQLDARSHPDLLSEMQKDLKHAVQLDPNFADAYGLLALAYTWQGKRQEAIAPAEKAVELSPRNDQWTMNLAGFYANAKRYDDALKLCQRLTKSSNPGIAQEASQMFDSLSRYKAQMAQYAEWQKKQAAEEPAEEKEEDSQQEETSQADVPVLKHREPATIPESSVLHDFEGMLTKVSCAGNRTTFYISMNAKQLTLMTSDMHQVSFSGKQSFSCDLHDVRVKGFYSRKLDRNEIMTLHILDTATGK